MSPRIVFDQPATFWGLCQDRFSKYSASYDGFSIVKRDDLQDRAIGPATCASSEQRRRFGPGRGDFLEGQFQVVVGRLSCLPTLPGADDEADL